MSSGIQPYQNKSYNKGGSKNKEESRKSDILEMIHGHEKYDCVFC